eukprot:2980094-Pyramimonas_sp.AAC.1
MEKKAIQQQLTQFERKLKEPDAMMQQLEGGSASGMDVDPQNGAAGGDKDPKVETQRFTKLIESTSGVEDEVTRARREGGHHRTRRMARERPGAGAASGPYIPS